jgi:hypothetical protein
MIRPVWYFDLQLPLPITTEGMGSNPAYGEVYSIQHCVIKLVSDLRQVSDFLRVVWFPPPIKLTDVDVSFCATLSFLITSQR